MEEWSVVAMGDGLRRQVENVEANDPYLRQLKDAVSCSDANLRAIEASAASEDGSVPEAIQAVETAIIELDNYSDECQRRRSKTF
jgi:hypothetical protein